MTLDELIAAVPIYERNGKPFYIVLSDIPHPWRTQFDKAMIGSGRPAFDGVGPCAYAWDWAEWLKGGRWGDGGPQGVTGGA